MSKSCFNCANFSGCPILRKANQEDYDSMYEVFVNEYGKYCIDYLEV
jgi:hypothetical protein